MRATDQRGFAAPAALTLAMAIVLVAVGAAVLGAVAVAQRRVNAAADLAALAGASAVQQGSDGCAAARRIATLNGASLSRCEVVAPLVRVATRVELATPWSRTVEVQGRAVAGPR